MPKKKVKLKRGSTVKGEFFAVSMERSLFSKAEGKYVGEGSIIFFDVKEADSYGKSPNYITFKIERETAVKMMTDFAMSIEACSEENLTITHNDTVVEETKKKLVELEDDRKKMCIAKKGKKPFGKWFDGEEE